jgi:branched-chain amino acid transport system substrate-binding protein
MRTIRVIGAMAIALSSAVLMTSGAAVGASSAKAPIVIGDICSCTGPDASSVAISSPTVQGWADAMNASGGIEGHKVDLIVKDDEYNPTTGVSEVQQMVSQDHAVAIFDNSDVDTAWASYAEKANVPVIGGTESQPGYTNPDFFPVGFTINELPGEALYLAEKVHSTKIALLYCAEVPSCQQATTALKAAAPKTKVHVAYSTSISYSAPNYSAQCLAAKQSGATSIFVGDAAGIVAKVAANCATQGYTPIEIGNDGTVANNWLTTPGMQGNIDGQPDIPFFVHDSATAPMFAALKKFEPSSLTSPSFGEIVVQAWVAGALFQAAARAGNLTNTVTAAEIKNGLYSLHATTLGGLSPPLTFVKGKATANLKCFFLMGIKNGKWVQDFGKGTTCLK